MKRFSIPTLALLVMLIVSACGASQTTPTVDPVQQAIDLQSTVIAAGYTNVAQTQTALPTATWTIVPTSTNTPFPTATFIPLATLEAVLTATAGNSSQSSDPCVNTLMPARLEGEPVKVRVDNSTREDVTLSINLHQARQGGQCGYRSYVLSAGQGLVVGDLVEGCYSIWAWTPNPKNYFMVTNGTSCLNVSQSWVFVVTPNEIKLKQ